MLSWWQKYKSQPGAINVMTRKRNPHTLGHDLFYYRVTLNTEWAAIHYVEEGDCG